VSTAGLQAAQEHVRFTALACVDVVLAAHADTVAAASACAEGSGNPLTGAAQKVLIGVWLAMHDPSEEIANYAAQLWERSDLELTYA
jgi:hypothetical protein